MKSVYERAILKITEFDSEDVITTSGDIPTPEPPSPLRKAERENVYRSFTSFDGPGAWF